MLVHCDRLGRQIVGLSEIGYPIADTSGADQSVSCSLARAFDIAE